MRALVAQGDAKLELLHSGVCMAPGAHTPLCSLVAKRSEPRTKKYPQGNHCFLFLVLKDYLSIGQPDANPDLGYFLHAAANSLLVFRCHFLLHLKQNVRAPRVASTLWSFAASKGR